MFLEAEALRPSRGRGKMKSNAWRHRAGEANLFGARDSLALAYAAILPSPAGTVWLEKPFPEDLCAAISHAKGMPKLGNLILKQEKTRRQRRLVMTAQRHRSMHAQPILIFVVAVIASPSCQLRADEFAAPLPAGVTAVWDLDKSYRETTPTRDRICLNGLCRWQPAQAATPKEPQPPTGSWGYFKVPGAWPGISDYMQKDSQTLYRHPGWHDAPLGSLRAAWYEREFQVPDSWTGRRVTLSADYVNSIATVFVDGKHAGELRFPGGELDITAASHPGAKHSISMLVAAVPQSAVMLSYTDTAAARGARHSARRGLCGDVFLVATPPGARITQVRVDSSVRTGHISALTSLTDLSSSTAYTLCKRTPGWARSDRLRQQAVSRGRRPGRSDLVRDGLEARPPVGPEHARQRVFH